MYRFTLKTKMTLAISLLVAVLLSVLAFSAELYFVSQTKELVHNQQFAMVSAIAEQTDDKLLCIQTELVMAAGTIDQSMMDDPRKLMKFFEQRPDTQAMFDNGLFLFSPQGKLLFESPSEAEMLVKDYSQREYLKKTLETRSPQISEPFISAQTHRHPIIMLTAPIYNHSGRIVAILGGSLDLTKSNFLSRISSIKQGEQGYLFLFSPSRRIQISHPDRERIMRHEIPVKRDALFEKAVAGFEGTGERINTRGVPVITAYKRLKTTGWVLGSNYLQSEAFEPVQRARRFLLAALLVVFGTSSVVVWLLMRHLTAPLIDFTRQIRVLSRTDEAAHVRVTTGSSEEIQLLGDAFNQLLRELAGQKKELRNQLDFSQKVIDTTPISIFYKDRDGRYLGCNKAFETFTGLCRESLLGKTIFDIAPVEVAETIGKADGEVCGLRSLHRHECTLPDSEGKIHHLIFFKNVFPAADGTTGVIGAMLDVTESKEAHSALEAQKEFAESLVQNFTLPTFVLDREHRVVIWNHACEALTGVPAVDILGSDQVSRVFHQDDRRLLAELVIDGDGWMKSHHYSTMTTPAHLPDAIQAEAWYTDQQGKKHYVAMTAAPIFDGRGEVICAIQTIEEITERKQAQDAHEKTRRQLQLILDAAGEGIYGIDREGRITFVNPAAAHMLGWEAEEMLAKDQHSMTQHGRNDATPYPEGDCPICSAVHEGRPADGTGVFRHKDGTSFPIDFVSTPIREDGELVGAVVMFKDTTERNQVEEQVLKLSQAVVQSPISILITDTSGNIEYVNPKFTQISGYQADEVLGLNPRIFKSGRTGNEVYQDLWSTISSGRIWSGEIYNKHKDGTNYCEHATISPIRNSSGVISHYMAFKENMTDRKRLEDQLRHAQKMEAIGQLAGGVAHDFNNILTVIMGFGQLLHYSLDPEDARRGHMEQILDAADRATHLTKSLLAFSRKQVMLLQQVELNDLARKHTKFLIRIIGEDVALKTAFSEERLVVLADSGQIEQVLMNLATNARDAMPGGGELSIKTETVQLGKEFQLQHGFGTPGRYALITISDTGQGMDAATQQKIFEPFFTTKDPGRGTGLGLSIVYGIVKQHGGYITMASRCGFGTTFSVYLPLVTEHEQAMRKAPALVPNGGNETILVVEDDPAVRRLVESVLKRFGYKVLLAESGDEAIEIFQHKWQDVDLALMDVIMPNMNGTQVCAVLKERCPALKVLFLSGYTADVIEDKGIAVEGIDIISKPAKPIELAKKVRELLDAA